MIWGVWGVWGGAGSFSIGESLVLAGAEDPQESDVIGKGIDEVSLRMGLSEFWYSTYQQYS